MGYRFGLYNFAKISEGGYVDFDFSGLATVLQNNKGENHIVVFCFCKA